MSFYVCGKRKANLWLSWCAVFLDSASVFCATVYVCFTLRTLTCQALSWQQNENKSKQHLLFFFSFPAGNKCPVVHDVELSFHCSLSSSLQTDKSTWRLFASTPPHREGEPDRTTDPGLLFTSHCKSLSRLIFNSQSWVSLSQVFTQVYCRESKQREAVVRLELILSMDTQVELRYSTCSFWCTFTCFNCHWVKVSKCVMLEQLELYNWWFYTCLCRHWVISQSRLLYCILKYTIYKWKYIKIY